MSYVHTRLINRSLKAHEQTINSPKSRKIHTNRIRRMEKLSLLPIVPPRDLPSRPAIHRQRYSKTEIANDAPDPPATMTAVEYTLQLVRTGDPNGPSTQAFNSMPVGGKIVPSGTSPGGCRCPWARSPTTVVHRFLVHPFFARMRNTIVRPSPPSFCLSQMDATVNGWEAILDRSGMQIRKCWPGAQVRRPGVTMRNRMVRPARISACA